MFCMGLNKGEDLEKVGFLEDSKFAYGWKAIPIKINIFWCFSCLCYSWENYDLGKDLNFKKALYDVFQRRKEDAFYELVVCVLG